MMLKLAYQIGFELALQEELKKVAAPLPGKAMIKEAPGLWERIMGLFKSAPPKPGSWEAFQAKALPAGDATTTKAFQRYGSQVRQGGSKSVGKIRP